jgi:hypothetical protein
VQLYCYFVIQSSEFWRNNPLFPSQRVSIIVYFVIDSVRKRLDTPTYNLISLSDVWERSADSAWQRTSDTKHGHFLQMVFPVSCKVTQKRWNPSTLHLTPPPQPTNRQNCMSEGGAYKKTRHIAVKHPTEKGRQQWGGGVLWTRKCHTQPPDKGSYLHVGIKPLNPNSPPPNTKHTCRHHDSLHTITYECTVSTHKN